MTRTSSVRRIAAVAAGALLAVMTFVAGHATSSPRPQTTPTAAASPHPAAPAAVAAQLVRRLNDPLLTDTDRAQLLGSLTAPSAPDLLATFTPGPGFEQATGLAADAAARRPLVASVVPVETNLLVATRSRARVAVWAVTVIGTRRLGQLVGSWSTETVDLRRAGGRWLLAGYRSTPGPVPVSTQPPTPIATVLASLGTGRER